MSNQELIITKQCYSDEISTKSYDLFGCFCFIVIKIGQIAITVNTLYSTLVFYYLKLLLSKTTFSCQGVYYKYLTDTPFLKNLYNSTLYCSSNEMVRLLYSTPVRQRLFCIHPIRFFCTPNLKIHAKKAQMQNKKYAKKAHCPCGMGYTFFERSEGIIHTLKIKIYKISGFLNKYVKVYTL